MAAYVIVDIDIHSPESYEEYKRLAPPSISAYGGRYLIRGGKVEQLEGKWQPKRCVVLEFPSVEQAKAWWDSPEYREARDLRWATADSQLIIAEGV